MSILKPLEKIQTYLVSQQIDAAFITPQIMYFTSLDLKVIHMNVLLGVVIFKERTPLIICPKMEVPDALAAGWIG